MPWPMICSTDPKEISKQYLTTSLNYLSLNRIKSIKLTTTKRKSFKNIMKIDFL